MWVLNLSATAERRRVINRVGILRVLPFGATVLAATVAGSILWGWLEQLSVDVVRRERAAEGSLAEAVALATEEARDADLTGCFKANREIPPGSTQGVWSGFRGSNRDNLATHAGTLLRRWPETGPVVRWSIPVGDGHAMPALANGSLYLLDYDESRGGDCLRCLNADTGQERWEHLYAVKTKRNHGISRTVAATDGEAVVTLGPQTHVLCLNAADGAYRWGISLRSKYGARVPLWYAGQCPLIDSGLVILAPAGPDVLLCGLRLTDGARIFETPNPGKLKMSHASIMVLVVEGVRQYIYAGLGGIVGVAAEGKEQGLLLWQTDQFNPSVVAPSPVPLTDGRFFMTAGYGSGGAMFQVSREGTNWEAKVLFKTDRKQFASEQQTPVAWEGLLYTVLPGDGGGDRQQLACMSWEGERFWTSGREHTFGLGPYVLTPDGLMYLLDDNGSLTLAQVGREGFKLLGRHALMKGQGRDAWGPMVLADNRLYLRDSERLYCVQVGEE